MGVNSLRLHLYACLIELGIIPVISTQFEGGIKFYPPGRIQPVEFDQAWNTGKNGCKFTEITLYASLVELGIIPMNSTGIYPNGFTPNSTGRIRPV